MNMKKFLSVLVVLLTLCGVQMRAEGENDKVVIQSATIAAGEEFFLPIYLENELTYKAFQMEIVLPEGISPVYAENEDEELQITIEPTNTFLVWYVCQLVVKTSGK